MSGCRMVCTWILFTVFPICCGRTGCAIFGRGIPSREKVVLSQYGSGSENASFDVKMPKFRSHLRSTLGSQFSLYSHLSGTEWVFRIREKRCTARNIFLVASVQTTAETRFFWVTPTPEAKARHLLMDFSPPMSTLSETIQVKCGGLEETGPKFSKTARFQLRNRKDFPSVFLSEYERYETQRRKVCTRESTSKKHIYSCPSDCFWAPVVPLKTTTNFHFCQRFWTIAQGANFSKVFMRNFLDAPRSNLGLQHRQVLCRTNKSFAFSTATCFKKFISKTSSWTRWAASSWRIFWTMPRFLAFFGHTFCIAVVSLFSKLDVQCFLSFVINRWLKSEHPQFAERN